MNTKRFLLALIVFTLMLPLSGCRCRRHSCGDRSFAPPPQPCCNQGVPPGFVPNPNP